MTLFITMNKKTIYFFLTLIVIAHVFFSQNKMLFAQNKKVYTYYDILKLSEPDSSFYNSFKTNPSPLVFDADSEILSSIFNYPTTSFQLYPSINSVDSLSAKIKKFDITTSDFYNSYSNISITYDSLLDTIFKVAFQLNNKSYDSYSYFVPGITSADSVAIIIIPGSGNNQSSAIYFGTGYHGDILNRMKKYGDTYVFVKPNQDFLGIHYNNKLLRDEALVPYLINHGYSYSAYYLTQCIALTKLLKNKYKYCYIVGLSQGGSASLYVSLLTEPSGTIVASGFSVLFEKFTYMSLNQIIGDGIDTLFTNQKIYNTILAQNTKYGFTYGSLDISTYKAEAENNYTCNYFSLLSNVFCYSGSWGHNFATPIPTESLIEDIIRPIPILNYTSDSVALCSNDTSIITTGNAQGYLFQWYKNNTPLSGEVNDSLLVSSPGIYKVKVSTTSNIFAFSQSITFFTDTNNVSINISQPFPFCLDDTLLLSNTFPNPYSALQWYMNDSLLTSNNNSDTLLVTENGNYHTVITDTNGCVRTSNKDTIQFINIGTPVCSISPAGTLCSGDSSFLIYNNINNFLTNWYRNDSLLPTFSNKDSLLVLTSGIYHLVITDSNGCSKSSLKDTVSFISLPAPVLVSSSDTTSLCEGDSTFFIYNNAGNYFTQWFRNDTLITSNNNKDSLLINIEGAFHLTIADTNGCLTLSADYPINIKDTIKPLIFIDGDTLGINPVGASYQWFFQGSILFGETSNEHVADTTGNYFVQVILPNGCTVYSDTVNVMVTSVPDPQSGNLFNVVFNPDNQTLDVSFNNSVSGEINLKVVDMYGNIVKEFKIIKSSVYFSRSFNMSDVALGMYIVSILNKENFIHTKAINSPR